MDFELFNVNVELNKFPQLSNIIVLRFKHCKQFRSINVFVL